MEPNVFLTKIHKYQSFASASSSWDMKCVNTSDMLKKLKNRSLPLREDFIFANQTHPVRKPLGTSKTVL